MLIRLWTALAMGPSLPAGEKGFETERVFGDDQAEATASLKRFRFAGSQQWFPQMVPSLEQPLSSCSAQVQSQELVASRAGVLGSPR